MKFSMIITEKSPGSNQYEYNCSKQVAIWKDGSWEDRSGTRVDRGYNQRVVQCSIDTANVEIEPLLFAQQLDSFLNRQYANTYLTQIDLCEVANKFALSLGKKKTLTTEEANDTYKKIDHWLDEERELRMKKAYGHNACDSSQYYNSTDDTSSQYVDSLILANRFQTKINHNNNDNHFYVRCKQSRMFGKIKNKIEGIEEKIEQIKRYGHYR